MTYDKLKFGLTFEIIEVKTLSFAFAVTQTPDEQ